MEDKWGGRWSRGMGSCSPERHQPLGLLSVAWRAGTQER